MIIEFHYLDVDGHDRWTLYVTLHMTCGINALIVLVEDLLIQIVVHDAILFNFTEAWAIRFCSFIDVRVQVYKYNI